MPAGPTKIRIGRDAASDVMLTDKSVSRRHADLFLDNDGNMEILDLESSSGTYLIRGGKEENIARAKLKPADRIIFGEVEFSYEELLDRARGALLKLKPAAPVKAATPPPLPTAKASAPPPLPKAEAKPGCECGTIKKKGTPCPSCGAA
jgi:pSer/pThr/pTyr-binding forkhead associated (FHA) protein